MAKPTREQEIASHLTTMLADEGKLITAGFVAFMKIAVAPNPPDEITHILKLAYFAGAEHVWSSCLNVLDAGDEPTDADMRRMDMVQAEIDEIRAWLSLHTAKAEGQG